MILVLKNRKAINFYSVTLFLFCAHPCSNLYMKMRNEFCFFYVLYEIVSFLSHIITYNKWELGDKDLYMRNAGNPESRYHTLTQLSLWLARPGNSAYSDQQQALLGWDPLRTAYLKKTLTTVYLTGRFYPPKSSLALEQLTSVSIGEPGGGGWGHQCDWK